MGHGGRISWGRLILGGTLGLAIATALAVLIGPLVAMQIYGGGNYRIMSDAMAPALLPGDWVLAEALLQGQVPPRGAIVVYEHPHERGEHELLRVMGLPGESVQMRGGALYIDSRRAGMERLEDRVIPRRSLWRETLADGTSGIVMNTKRKIGLAIPAGSANGDDTRIFRVPNDAVFVLGDNRDSAIDSRFQNHGMVPIHKLKYRVWMIHTSLDRSARYITPRWDRFFRKVQ
jgi:signal peptidase I